MLNYWILGNYNMFFFFDAAPRLLRSLERAEGPGENRRQEGETKQEIETLLTSSI